MTSRVVPSSLFILASSLNKSLQSLISALTWWGEGGQSLSSLVQLCCGERNIANKYCWCVWGVLVVDGPHWVSHSPRQRVFSRCTLLWLPGCSMRALSQLDPVFRAFPSLRCSASQLLCKGTDPDGLCILCSFQVQASQVIRCLVNTLYQVGYTSYVPPCSWLLGFLGEPWGHSPKYAMCLLWGADLQLWHSWWMWTIHDPRKMCFKTGSLLTVW